jgi:hypothetical protein
MLKSATIKRIRHLEDYAYKEQLLGLRNYFQKFIQDISIKDDAFSQVKIKGDVSDLCYYIHSDKGKITYYENGEIDHGEYYENYDKDFDWYFLKFYDESLNEHISDAIKQTYNPLIEEIKKIHMTYGALHHCSDKTFIFEHYDQTTSDEGSETGRTNIIIPVGKTNAKGCIIHVDGDTYDLMDYDAFCFNAQFKHKMYNNTGSDVVLLVLHSRSSDFEVIT